MAEQQMVAVLSCGDVVTEWDPPEESYGEKPGWHWTRCPDRLCRGQRRVVKEIRPAREGEVPGDGKP